MSANTIFRAQDEHAVQEVDAEVVDLRQDGADVLGRVELERRLILGEIGNAGPRALRGGAHDAEDADDLVVVGRAGEQGPTRVHLRHDAARGPDVDARVVRPTAQQDIRGAVPQRHDLVREGVNRDTEGAREAEVPQLQGPLAVDEEVLRLQVAVQHAVLVAKVDPLEELIHEGLDRHGLQGAPLAVRVHVLLKVAVHVLKHQHEFVLGVDDVVQANDVLVLELFHEGNLADRGRGSALFGVEVDFLEGDQLAGLSVATFENLSREINQRQNRYARKSSSR